jgi:hypothetical protein
MARWKLFSKSKQKEEKITEPVEPRKENVEENIETIQEIEDQPLAEHHETLYTGVDTSKKGTSTPSDQRIWRDVDSIEENIDTLHMEKAKKPHSEIEKTVDKLIENRTFEKQKSAQRKPANVIYVVSKPQPGEVRGDWAVRSHGKIFSHHKTKENAINEARKIAKKRDATVMVQNTDGTFSDGFKPR